MNNNLYTYTWDFGDNTSASSSNKSIIHEYEFNGIYSVQLKIFDKDELLVTLSSSVVIQDRLNFSLVHDLSDGGDFMNSFKQTTKPGFKYEYYDPSYYGQCYGKDFEYFISNGTYKVYLSFYNCDFLGNYF